MSRKRAFALLAFCGLACVHGNGAQATNLSGASGNVSVLASQSVLMQQSGANTTTLAIPEAGELFVTLTDLQFPTSFASLQYAVSNAVGATVALTPAGTTTTVDLTAATTLYANVFATLGSTPSGSPSPGLYNLTATFVSAVPLPGSFVSFAGGCLLVLVLGLYSAHVARVWGRVGEEATAANPA